MGILYVISGIFTGMERTLTLRVHSSCNLVGTAFYFGWFLG